MCIDIEIFGRCAWRMYYQLPIHYLYEGIGHVWLIPIPLEVAGTWPQHYSELEPISLNGRSNRPTIFCFLPFSFIHLSLPFYLLYLLPLYVTALLRFVVTCLEDTVCLTQGIMAIGDNNQVYIQVLSVRGALRSIRYLMEFIFLLIQCRRWTTSGMRISEVLWAFKSKT